ncbi:sodium/potassium-transporting ATPase subunit beta-1-like [Venturia canescens]|uniref:sodium/potassium-transporting ATPase subunit beta-1-like n=1 Tax=Venturia canescens TaxID=32260 RepID=UPI001C9BCE9E|nr:sodium/potassium-transporting ATPase subunit beta-1-like [Venturia canescens]
MIMHDEAYYRSRVPIKDLGPWKNFLRFIWDGERRAFLDRTAKDWSVLGLFYLCFFGVLFSLFALQMWVALGFVGYLEKPYMQRNAKTVGSFSHGSRGRSFVQSSVIVFDNPGLGFIPNVFSPSTSPIIWVGNTNGRSKPEPYIGAIRKFLDGYKRNESEYDMDCSEGIFRSEFTRPCFFNTDLLGPCSLPPYGYRSPYQPCVLLKFNKRFDWVPIYYDQTSELPEMMPYNLRQTIRASQESRVWLSCAGASNVDKEHLGQIEYYPAPGFAVEFFPFMGHPEYLAPLVGLVFKNLTADILVTVECSLWAQNIRQDRRYCLDFQIMIGK